MMAQDLLNACIAAAECETNVMDFHSFPKTGLVILTFAATG
jgi:hypothetical protein